MKEKQDSPPGGSSPSNKTRSPGTSFKRRRGMMQLTNDNQYITGLGSSFMADVVSLNSYESQQPPSKNSKKSLKDISPTNLLKKKSIRFEDEVAKQQKVKQESKQEEFFKQEVQEKNTKESKKSENFKQETNEQIVKDDPEVQKLVKEAEEQMWREKE